MSLWPESIFAAALGLLILLLMDSAPTQAEREIEWCRAKGWKVEQVLDKTICKKGNTK